VLSATLIEGRKITDRRHGYRGRVSLIDLGNGSRKGTDKLAPDLEWLALPDGFGRPKARFRSPSFLEIPGEQDPAKTTSALEQLTDSSRTLRQVRKVPDSDIATYSITSSAISKKSRVIVRPSALAVFRLMTSSNFVGCWTGNSAGFAPLRILSK
jgi:hypothetical protein